MRDPYRGMNNLHARANVAEQKTDTGEHTAEADTSDDSLRRKFSELQRRWTFLHLSDSFLAT